MPVPTLITELSTTAASNYPAGTDSPATLDDVQRAHAAFIAQIRDGVQVTNAAAKTAPVDADYLPINDSAASNLIKKVTWANIKATLNATLSFQAAGSYAASGANADITSLSALTNGIVGTSGNQTIAGIKTFSSMPVMPVQSMVRLHTANGSGSTNTAIRRFTTTVTSQGTDVTYADSATLGATFTINTNGVYAISYTDAFVGSSRLGLSLNSTQLSTAIVNITTADKLCAELTPAANNEATISWTGYLASGAVVRPHSDLGGNAASLTLTQFTIVRIA